MRVKDLVRLQSKFVVDDAGCWLWKGTVFTSGYGQFKMTGRGHLAHRLVYQVFVGPIPEGLQLDHLCRVPLCVNPAHLEPVTCRENLMRAPRWMVTACPRGHTYDEANTYVTKKGERTCRACRRKTAA